MHRRAGALALMSSQNACEAARRAGADRHADVHRSVDQFDKLTRPLQHSVTNEVASGLQRCEFEFELKAKSVRINSKQFEFDG
jgi:hypothetical protein